VTPCSLSAAEIWFSVLAAIARTDYLVFLASLPKDTVLMRFEMVAEDASQSTDGILDRVEIRLTRASARYEEPLDLILDFRIVIREGGAMIYRSLGTPTQKNGYVTSKGLSLTLGGC